MLTETSLINIKDLVVEKPRQYPFDTIRRQPRKYERLLSLIPQLDPVYAEGFLRVSSRHFVIAEGFNSLRKKEDSEAFLKEENPGLREQGAFMFLMEVVEKAREEGRSPLTEELDTIRRTLQEVAVYGEEYYWGMPCRGEFSASLTNGEYFKIAERPDILVWIDEIVRYGESTFPWPNRGDAEYASFAKPLPVTRKF